MTDIFLYPTMINHLRIIEEYLAKIISDKSHVDYIIQYIKNNREIKTTSELRFAKNKCQK